MSPLPSPQATGISQGSGFKESAEQETLCYVGSPEMAEEHPDTYSQSAL